MRNKLFAPLLLALAAVSMSVPAQAQQDLKIGVVNLARLVVSSPQAKRARQSMEGKFSARKEELESKQESFRSDVERLKRDGQVMSDSAREKLEGQIRDQQRRLKLMQDEYNEDVTLAEKKEMDSLREDIRAVIDQFAQEQGYDLIVGDAILYASEQVDVTDQVLSRLKDRL